MPIDAHRIVHHATSIECVKCHCLICDTVCRCESQNFHITANFQKRNNNNNKKKQNHFNKNGNQTSIPYRIGATTVNMSEQSTKQCAKSVLWMVEREKTITHVYELNLTFTRQNIGCVVAWLAKNNTHSAQSLCRAIVSISTNISNRIESKGVWNVCKFANNKKKIIIWLEMHLQWMQSKFLLFSNRAIEQY